MEINLILIPIGVILFIILVGGLFTAFGDGSSREDDNSRSRDDGPIDPIDY